MVSLLICVVIIDCKEKKWRRRLKVFSDMIGTTIVVLFVMNGMNPCIVTLDADVVVGFLIFQFFQLNHFRLAGFTRIVSIGKTQDLKFTNDLL